MLVHKPTLFLVLAATSSLGAMAVWIEERRSPSAALRLWIGAYATAAAFALTSLVLFSLDPPLATVVPPVFGMLSLALMQAGLAAHLRRPVRLLAFAPVLAWAVLAATRWYGLPLDATYFERRIVLCVVYAGYGVAIVCLILRQERIGRVSLALGGIAGLYGLFYIVRLLFLVPGVAPPEAALADFWVTASIYKAILFVAATSYLLIALHRERAERDLRQAAEIDSLTGMRNRRAFRGRAVPVLGADPGAFLAVIDLDRFKAINDSCGHAGGDRVLAQFATVLRSATGEGDLCGRLGGEEFALLLRGETRSGAIRRLEEVALRFRREAARTVDLPFEATFSAGLAQAGAGADLDEVLARADAALYRAKREGRDRTAMGAEPPRPRAAALYANAAHREEPGSFLR